MVSAAPNTLIWIFAEVLHPANSSTYNGGYLCLITRPAATRALRDLRVHDGP